MKKRSQCILITGFIIFLCITFATVILYGPRLAKADKKTQYKVVICNERKLEQTLNDMTLKGWEFVQSEMAMDVLIFRK